MQHVKFFTALVALVSTLTVGSAAAQEEDSSFRPTVDIDAAQAILAVQGLDGWLLTDKGGTNAIANTLVNPAGELTRQWFYFIPAEGQPTVLVHKSEVASFDRVPGTKIEYSGYRDLKGQIRTLLKGAKTIAMEYAPKSKIPSLTRIDSQTARMVRRGGVTVESSAQLVQFTKSLWGPKGRIAHYVAVHHLSKLRAEALEFIARKLSKKESVTEYDVQQHILVGYAARGIKGDPPVVAAGPNTADPTYAPTAERSAAIGDGDLVVIDMWAQVEDGGRPIVANISWVAYIGASVPDRYANMFKVVVEARDEAIALVKERVSRRRAVKGFEPDQVARAVVGKAGFADRFVHRTGHSLDTDLHGDGANVDDYETHDTRSLVMGSGFTIGPGIYVKDDFGVRTEVGLFIGRNGVEVTSELQTAISKVSAAPF
jgi:Xaa-Pro aminopeptidase